MSVPWDLVRVWSVESAGNFDKDMEVRPNHCTDMSRHVYTLPRLADIWLARSDCLRDK